MNKCRLFSFILPFIFISNPCAAMDNTDEYEESYYYQIIKEKTVKNSYCGSNYDYVPGKLYFCYGTMGAGKSALAISTIKELESKYEIYVYVPKAISSKQISSRNGYSYSVSNVSLDEMEDEMEEDSLLIVDEAQFLSEDEIGKIRELCENKKVITICFGLLTTFENKIFDGTKHIIKIADTIFNKSMKCEECKKNDAEYNFRNSSDKGLKVLDKGKYQSLCKNCFKSKNSNLIITALSLNH